MKRAVNANANANAEAGGTLTVANPALSPCRLPSTVRRSVSGGDGVRPVVTVQPGLSDTDSVRSVQSVDSLPPGSMEQLEHTHHIREVFDYADKLDITTVCNWSYKDVVQGFLLPLELEQHGPTFIENRINGDVLLGLSKDDLRAMVPPSDPKAIPIGDRNLMWSVLKLLIRRKHHWDHDRVLWTLSTPTGGWQYYRNCFHLVKYKCCPCCVELTHYKLTPTQMTVRYEVPKVNMSCGGLRTDIHNLRFLKEVYYNTNLFCWCYRYNELHVVFRHVDASGGRGAKNTKVTYLAIAHPQVGQDVVDQLNFLWGRQRLVGGNT